MIGLTFWLAAGIVAYTYAGYPLLMAALSRLRRPPADHPEHLPPLTLVIAAFNEEAVVGQKLEQSLALDYPPDRLQIIVAADGSDDGTVAIASAYADRGVLVLHRPERAGKLAAMSRAVEAATGDIVVFSDANNRYDQAALREMAGPFASPDVGAVSGRKVVMDEDALGYSEGLYWRYESAIKRWETRFGSTVGVNGEIIAVRRNLFAAAPPGIINDDTWLARLVLRAGYRIAYAERAVSIERVSADASAEQERRSRMVAGQIQVLLHAGRELPWRRPVITWQLISHKLLRPLVPLWMAVCLAAAVLSLFLPGNGRGIGAVAALASPWNIAAVASQAVFYGLAAVGERVRGPLAGIAYLPRFLWDSNVAAVRGMARLLSGRQSVLWDRVARRQEPAA
ncbi:MAG: glycosyltransferase family 2 protein [Actinobacteria bacterium]|nr:glycosyltransferase family 2 protein [Actinomycetota bacterium]